MTIPRPNGDNLKQTSKESSSGTPLFDSLLVDQSEFTAEIGILLLMLRAAL